MSSKSKQRIQDEKLIEELRFFREPNLPVLLPSVSSSSSSHRVNNNSKTQYGRVILDDSNRSIYIKKLNHYIARQKVQCSPSAAYRMLLRESGGSEAERRGRRSSSPCHLPPSLQDNHAEEEEEEQYYHKQKEKEHDHEDFILLPSDEEKSANNPVRRRGRRRVLHKEEKTKEKMTSSSSFFSLQSLDISCLISLCLASALAFCTLGGNSVVMQKISSMPQLNLAEAAQNTRLMINSVNTFIRETAANVCTQCAKVLTMPQLNVSYFTGAAHHNIRSMVNAVNMFSRETAATVGGQFRWLLNQVLLIGAITIAASSICFLGRLVHRRHVERKKLFYGFVNRALAMVKAQHEASVRDTTGRVTPYVPIRHIYDTLAEPQQRLEHVRLWARVVTFINEHESRVHFLIF